MLITLYAFCLPCTYNYLVATKYAVLHKLVLCLSHYSKGRISSEDSVVTLLQLVCCLAVSLLSLVYSLACPSEICLIWSKAQSRPHLPEFPRRIAIFTVRLGTIITFGLGRLYPCLPHCPLCSRETERNGVRRRAHTIAGAALCGECSSNACSINLQDFQHTCHTAVKNHVVVFWLMTPSRLATTD